MNKTIPSFQEETPRSHDILSPQFGGQADTLRSGVTAALSKHAEFNESTLKVQQSERKEDEGYALKEEPLKKAVIDPKQMTNQELNEYVSSGKLPQRLLKDKCGGGGGGGSPWKKFLPHGMILSSPSSIVSPIDVANFFAQGKENQTALQISNISNGLLSPTQPLRKIATTEGSLVSEANELGFIVRGNSSQAASSAIKSLQQKVKALERENSLLKDEKQRRSSEEREDLKQQLERQLEQLTRLKEEEFKHSLLIIETQKNELEEELNEYKQKLVLRDRQLVLLEGEKEKHLEENQLEKESWMEERERMIRQMNALQEKSNNAEIILKEQNMQLQRTRNELMASENRVKQISRDQGSLLKSSQQKCTQLNRELTNLKESHKNSTRKLETKIRRLESKLKSAQDKAARDQRVLKKEISDLQQKKREHLRSNSARKPRKAHNTSIDSNMRPSSAHSQRTPTSSRSVKRCKKARAEPVQILNPNVFDSQNNSEAGHQDYMLISEGYRPVTSKMKQSDLEEEKQSATMNLVEITNQIFVLDRELAHLKRQEKNYESFDKQKCESVRKQKQRICEKLDELKRRQEEALCSHL